MNPTGKLGDRPRVRVTRVVRVQYRLEWEYDGSTFDHDLDGCGSYVPDRKRRVRYVNSRAVAYRMAAMRLIFVRRDGFATGIDNKGHPSGCSLCDAEPQYAPDDPRFCRYHDHGERFERLRDRLAGWLRWRDGRIAALLDEPTEEACPPT